MNLKVTITGTRDLDAKMKRIDDALKSQALANATLAGALVIEGAAKAKAPVRTGTLRRSIHSAIETSSPTIATALVGTDLIYAPFVEYGTRFMSAQPYLRPALDEKRAAAQDVIRDAFKAIILQAAR
jgi:HK97 gp10 family phage protein